MRTARANGGRIPWMIPSTDPGILLIQDNHEYLARAATLATIPINATGNDQRIIRPAVAA